MPPEPTTRAGVEVEAPAIDSIDDVLMRQRIHAQLFSSEREGLWIDRFELVAKLGAGGMGTVWEAQDHRLHRRVALKFLRSTTQASPQEERRLFREAQALARMQHPNVIAVYDVGRHEGRVWIAMELVPGQTLQAWRGAEEPTPEQILAVWLAAGRGLAAIHAAGLIHRDIKPSNILLGDDGRARVIDFGLVCAERPEPPTSTSQSASATTVRESPTDDAAAELLTQGEGFAGTPAYASPEQLRGLALDSRSDQYTLCVCVWEALTGERPSTTSKPGAARLSRRVHEALVRGLSEQPQQRFASLDPLLDALAPPRRRWLAPVALTALLGVGVGAAGVALLGEEPPSRGPTCTDAGAGLDPRWGPDTREALAATIPAAEVATFTLDALDRWAEQWRQISVEACEQTLVDQLSSAATLDRRRSCLAHQAESFSFIVEGLGRESTDAEQALTSIAALDDPRDCLRAEGPSLDQLSAEARAEYQAIDQARLRLATEHRNRSLAARRDQALELHRRARLADFPGLEARLALLEGHLASFAGDPAAAERHLSEAIDVGERLELVDVRAKAWLELSRLALDLDLDRERARWYWRRAQPLLAHARPHTRATSHWCAGRIHFDAGELDAAEDALDAAIEAYEAIGPRANPGLAASLRLAAGVAAKRRDADAVEALLTRVTHVELRANAKRSAKDSRSGIQVLAEATDQLALGKLDAAEATLERAIPQLEREHGPSVELAGAHVTRSAIADARGQIDVAMHAAIVADEMIRKQGGSHHFDRVYALNALAVAAYRSEDFAAAEAAFERCLLVLERHYEPGAPELIMPRVNLAEARHALGHHREAERLLLDALPRLEAELGADHPDNAIAHKALGAVYLALERAPEARVELERAAALHASVGAGDPEAAETAWLLAQALAAEGEATRALDQAADARARFAALGDDFRDRTIALDNWIATNRKDR